MQRDYEEKYTELSLLGRGNYGSAYVIQNNLSGSLLVAKKMNMDGMSESQIEAARGEIQILEKFSDTKLYPFIVKYNECFIFEKTLIIVMEFCQFGDLATFLKYAKKKGDLLDEKIILAWFIMLLMGIQSLHSKNILHRDLKSANIFLTSNKFIKIGDFGISKVLDATSAKTFVGTPYYLSPEVCSNKKYDLRSDLWSLGCILYELCTLNYPFNANNILSLAMKITSEQVQPISSKYSKELNDILMGLLTKDQNKRITLEQILKNPYIEKFMKDNGSCIEQICSEIPLKRSGIVSKVETSKLQTIKNSKKQQAEETMKTINSNFQKTNNNSTLEFTKTFESNSSLSISDSQAMSPKDLAKMRKEERIRKEQQRLKQAARENLETRKFASSKKQEQFGGSGSNFNEHTQTLKMKMQNYNKETAEEKRKAKCGLGDNQEIDLASLCELTTKMKDLGVTENFSQIELNPMIEEKVIKGNQNYKMYTEAVEEEIDEELEEYYDEDFEDYIPEETSKIEQAQQEKEAVGVFMSVISGNDVGGISPTKRAAIQKVFEPIGNKSVLQKKHNLVNQCVQIIGQKRYESLYALVASCYENGKYKEKPELRDLRKTGSNSEKKSLNLIEELIYLELDC